MAEETAVAVKTPQPTGLTSPFASDDAMERCIKVGRMLVRSSMVPDPYKITGDRTEDDALSNVMIAMDYAARTGASVLEVMQNLHIIHSRPSWSSAYLIAMINASHKYVGGLQFVFDGTPGENTYGCHVEAVERATGERKVGTTVTIQTAQKAGWWERKGGLWQTIPRQMLQYRAAAFFSRLHCPEITLGMHTADEQEDIGPEKEPILLTDADVQVEAAVQPEPEPAPRKRRGRKKDPEPEVLTPETPEQSVITKEEAEAASEAPVPPADFPAAAPEQGGFDLPDDPPAPQAAETTEDPEEDADADVNEL